MTTTTGDIASRERKGRFPLIRKKWPRLIPKIKEAIVECSTKLRKKKKRR